MRARRWYVRLLAVLAALHAFSPASPLSAHPIPRLTHDRTIVIQLTPEAVIVDYRLEIDDWTIVYVDLPAVNDKVDLSGLRKPSDYYEAFTRTYAPILADNLVARFDDRLLTFVCVKRTHEVIDHVRCDFRFQAAWKVAPDSRHEFTFREGNYELQEGMVRLSLRSAPTLTLLHKTEPDEALKNRPASELRPGDDERLRKASAQFEVRASEPGTAAVIQSEPPEETPAPRSRGALKDLLDSDDAFWVLMFLAACYGGVHALEPGHGKTLVAAYLVGERGTIWHALFLGVITTLTHTGSVIALVIALYFFLPPDRAGDVGRVLGLLGGLLVVGLGFWILLRRLSGRADHFHIGGHGHHHHHHHHHDHEHSSGGHYHDEDGHTHPLPGDSRTMGWLALIVLGISGGLVPCPGAIIMLGMSTHRLPLALPLLLAFSAGLAGVLIAIGTLVVLMKGFATSRWGEEGRLARLFQWLPVASAVVVTAIGLWLCYDSVYSQAPPSPARAQAHP